VRILLVSHPPLAAEHGAAQTALALAAALRERGHDAEAWSPAPLPPGLRWWRLWREQRRAIERYVAAAGPFDVLDLPAHSAGPRLSRAGYLLARSVQPELRYLRLDLASQFHSLSTAPRAVLHSLYGADVTAAVLAGWRRAQRILCLGSAELEWMRRRFPRWTTKLGSYWSAPAEAERVAFAEVRRCRRGRSSPLRTEGTHFLWIGRWAAHKGTTVLLRFIGQRIVSHPGNRFTLAGCGPEAERALPAEWIGSGQVRLLESFSRAELPALLAEHDAGLFTSKIEGWGLCLQEMLESGLPVYATEAGAVPDLCAFFPDALRPFPPPAEERRPLPDEDLEGNGYFTRFNWTEIALHYERQVLAAAAPLRRARRFPRPVPATNLGSTGARVLLVSHHERRFLGGAPLADLALGDELARLGYEVDSLFYEDVLPRWIRGTWRQLLFPWLVAARFMARHVRFPYDVVESTAGDAWVMRLTSLAMARRPLFSARTHGLEHRRAILDKARRRARGAEPGRLSQLYHYRYRLWEVERDLRGADVVFFLNREDSRHALDVLGLPAASVHTIPNGVTRHLLATANDAPEPTAFDVLFLGRWSPAKGADLLPAIVRRVFAEDSRFRLTCAGVDISEEQVLASFAPHERDRIVVIRRYEPKELASILVRHAVLLTLSPAEGCSLSLLEGMAGGLVPLTTRTGYAIDLIRPGWNGFLLDPDDAPGFAATLLGLAETGDLDSLRRRARETAAAHSWREITLRRVRLWSEAEERRANRPAEDSGRSLLPSASSRPHCSDDLAAGSEMDQRPGAPRSSR
jgi:glycosyltransferase involved in cell wall biosynthesis